MSARSLSPAPIGRSVFVFDLARATAALVVLGAHARSFVLLDAPQQPDLSGGGRLFFAATALGHQAVIVFLVISGALVTRSMLAMQEDGRWSASVFAATRLNRLWLVLLPCLAIGGFEDRIGLALTDPMAHGPYGAPGVAAATVVQALGPATLAGNIVFLQGFAVPAFGSNVPLWTLAVEAWCYVGAGLIVSGWRLRGTPVRLALFALALAFVLPFVLDPVFWSLFPIWGVGAASVLWRHRGSRSGRFGPAFGSAGRRLRVARRTGTLGLFAAALLIAHVVAIGHQALADYVLAYATALLLRAWSDWRPAFAPLVRATRFAADFSYSLYLSHFPLLALLDAMVLHHRRLDYGRAAIVVWCVAVMMALAQAIGLWWVFERRTGALRTLLLAWLPTHRISGLPARRQVAS